MQTIIEQPIPIRGVRPRNRREMALVAASDLFHDRGYPNVSMTDLAREVSIGPSALYRHFDGKQDVLRIVVVGALEVLVDRLTNGTDDLPVELARIAVLHRRSGLLLRRERRHLDLVNRVTADALLAEFQTLVHDRIAARRPDLGAARVQILTTFVLGATWSRSYVEPDPDPDRAIALLTDVYADLLDSRFPGPGTTGPRAPARARRQSRREGVLAAATDLFAEHGYHAVGVDDLSTATRSATASVYAHVGSKPEILMTIVMRGLDHLLMVHNQAMAAPVAPDGEALQALRPLVRFLLENSNLSDVLLHEAGHLAAEDAVRFGRAMRAYGDEWELLLEDVAPGWTREERQLRIAAMSIAVGEAARDPLLRTLGDLEPALLALGQSLLNPQNRPVGDPR